MLSYTLKIRKSALILSITILLTSKDLGSEKEEIKCSNVIKRYKKVINFDNITKENIKEHNPDWPQIPDNTYRILIIGCSGSGKKQIQYLI